MADSSLGQKVVARAVQGVRGLSQYSGNALFTHMTCCTKITTWLSSSVGEMTDALSQAEAAKVAVPNAADEQGARVDGPGLGRLVEVNLLVARHAPVILTRSEKVLSNTVLQTLSEHTSHRFLFRAFVTQMEVPGLQTKHGWVVLWFAG